MHVLTDRKAAGRMLARRLSPYAGRAVLVLALPRGGVPVGYEIAAALCVPMDVLVVRKLGVPFMQECAMGAIAGDRVCVKSADIMAQVGVTTAALKAVQAREIRELRRREVLYGATLHSGELRDRTVLLVDDGAATGCTLLAAVHAHRAMPIQPIVAAVPVALAGARGALEAEAVVLVHIDAPDTLRSIGQACADFSQTSDEEVLELLARVRRGRTSTPPPVRG